VDGAETPKSTSFRGLLRTGPSGLDCGGPLEGDDERVSVVAGSTCLWTAFGWTRGECYYPSSTKNNQLRTGADKGNPTV
jgi:hypothetical protein